MFAQTNSSIIFPEAIIHFLFLNYSILLEGDRRLIVQQNLFNNFLVLDENYVYFRVFVPFKHTIKSSRVCINVVLKTFIDDSILPSAWLIAFNKLSNGAW